ncbi:hypothetical protein LTR53_007919 [Teratosphaeriaceae sp. CCFEE 6253]|nr:hypothetical protein LTR53_007919 [Teratosphaeriaceae sp. CCFEE 6253]
MEDLIATFYPHGEVQSGFALRTIERAENSSRLVPAKEELLQLYGRKSRETTAALSDVEDEDTKGRTGGKGLQFTFTHGPKAGRGYMLGTDANSCDIVLPMLKGISRRHCYLTFDEKRLLVLRDCSSNGTVVMYVGKGGERRRHFTWILGGHEVPDETKSIVIRLHTALKFQIVVAKRTFPDIYFENVDEFLGETAIADNLPFGALGIQSIASTAAPSGTHTPIQDPILLERDTLGRGAFGVVTRVWDVSTGREYASKRFTNLDNSDWEKEASLMRQSPHEHIVRLCFAMEKPSPQLVMEYVPLGNLEDQHRRHKISEDEAIIVLQQVLSALFFLHEQSPPIVHRDIKPGNLLVQSRKPMHIKLGDFGLSKASEDLTTLCGSPVYLPPELARHHGSKASRSRILYSHAVDIWSLGVVIYQYVYGLPQRGSGSALVWCKRLVQHLNDWESEELIDVLSRMIVMDPRRWIAARSCLNKALLLDQASDPSEALSAPVGYEPVTASQPISGLGLRTLDYEVRRQLDPRNECRADPAVLIGKASLLTTLSYDPNDGNKRHRSPDPNVCGGTKKRMTAIWKSPKQHNHTSHLQACADAKSPPPSHRQPDTMYECVLELLRDIRIGTESNETLVSRTIALVHDLCQRLDRLNIENICTETDDEAERTTVIGVSETQNFTLASLTSSDVASSMADLAQHFIHMTDLMIVDPETSQAGDVNQDSVGLSRSVVRIPSAGQPRHMLIASEGLDRSKSVKTPTQVYQLSLSAINLGSSRSTEAAASCATDFAANPTRRTCPSAMLDALNMSGDGQPWKVS